MANCEMCGRAAPLAKVSIEGAVLDVCESCARHGKMISAPRHESQRPGRPAQNRPAAPARKETTYIIVDDYAKKLKEARERLGLTQEEFSKKLNQRESMMHKFEAGQMRPSIQTALELQKALKIKLIEEFDDKTPASQGTEKSDGFTLGDFIKKK